jgi:hypothetical protein
MELIEYHSKVTGFRGVSVVDLSASGLSGGSKEVTITPPCTELTLEFTDFDQISGAIEMNTQIRQALGNVSEFAIVSIFIDAVVASEKLLEPASSFSSSSAAASAQKSCVGEAEAALSDSIEARIRIKVPLQVLTPGVVLDCLRDAAAAAVEVVFLRLKDESEMTKWRERQLLLLLRLSVQKGSELSDQSHSVRRMAVDELLLELQGQQEHVAAYMTNMVNQVRGGSADLGTAAELAQALSDNEDALLVGDEEKSIKELMAITEALCGDDKYQIGIGIVKLASEALAVRGGIFSQNNTIANFLNALGGRGNGKTRSSFEQREQFQGRQAGQRTVDMQLDEDFRQAMRMLTEIVSKEETTCSMFDNANTVATKHQIDAANKQRPGSHTLTVMGTFGMKRGCSGRHLSCEIPTDPGHLVPDKYLLGSTTALFGGFTHFQQLQRCLKFM